MLLLSLPDLAWVTLSDDQFLEKVSKLALEELNLSSLDHIDGKSFSQIRIMNA